MPTSGRVIDMHTVADVDVDRLADLATGIEQELIELVARRGGLVAAGVAARRLDAEIARLQDELGTVGELAASR
jgi:hypothetical protein